MTVREIYDSVLVEINKENAQSFTTEEFNYVMNKSALAFANERYNFYAVNQQISDDLRVLLKNQTFSTIDTTSIDPMDVSGPVFNPTTSYLITSITASTTATLSTVKDIKVGDIISFGDDIIAHPITNITGNVVTFTTSATTQAGVNIKLSTLPIGISDNLIDDRTIDASFVASDYQHLISCKLIWKTKRPSTGKISYITFPARKLTHDMLNAIQNNTYLKPSSSRPYHQLFNNSNNSGAIVLSSSTYKDYQNKPKVRIYIGNKNSVMELRYIVVDYLKIPEIITLKDSDIFSVASDTSQILEFPEYLKNELVKRCTIYLLEKAGDPRIQTQPAFNQEISSVPLNMQMEGRSRIAAQQQAYQQQQNQQSQ